MVFKRLFERRDSSSLPGKTVFAPVCHSAHRVLCRKLDYRLAEGGIVLIFYSITVGVNSMSRGFKGEKQIGF